ncbi:hypothetical protein PMAC_000975 [Pneumocystis sp. 'macacae']|nr:hypothetical protein PMAC_000975 [Pneumocystis sp. 'macacae']
MNKETVDRLISALSVIYAVDVNKTTRDEAQKFLDEIKNDINSWKYGIELTQSKDQKMDILRHFGLNLIEHNIQYNWDIYTNDIKIHMQNYIIKMCYDGVRDGTSHDQQEVHYIKQKISQILSNIVKKDLNFVLFDMDLALQNMFLASVPRDISLNTILNLIEDVFKSNDNSHLSKTSILSIESEILNQLCFALLYGNIEIKIASSDCLHALFVRPLSFEDKLLKVIHSFFEPNNLNHLRSVIEDIFSQVQYDNHIHFDEKKYSFLKKIVETIVALGTSHILNSQKKNTFYHLDIYLDIVIFTTKHPSLIVSFISLPFWIALLKSSLNKEQAVISILPYLLDTASSRLIRVWYENAQETFLKNSIEIKFLNYDIESVSEIHVFCGNYRRFMIDLIQIIFSIPTKDCLSYAQQHIEEFFVAHSNFINNNQTTSKKKTPDYFFYDSNFTFIESVLKGYKILNEKDEQQNSDLKKKSLSLLKYWFKKIIDMDIKVPLILSLQVQILVTFLCFFEEKEFLIPVLEKTILAVVYHYPDNALNDEVQTIRELRGKSGQELLRLAMELSDLLWNIYPQLEKIIHEIINKKSSENENIIFNTFLLIISQKSNNTQDEKIHYFHYIITKLTNTWNKTKSLFNFETFNDFFDFLGLQKIMLYIQSKNIHSIQDLSTEYLDIQGKLLTNELKEIRKMFWPIRAFRKLADYHLKIVSLENNNNDFLLKLWEPIIDFILPDIFNIIKHIHVLYNPDNWVLFAPELQFVISQSISEKFWFHGISLISKDEFYEEISNSENKIIGLAYDLGYFLRKNKEYCYMSIGLFSNFGNCFYKNPNLVQNLIESFFTDIKGLSLYTWSSILDSSISPLIIKCPYEYQASFLKVLLPYLFAEIDKKLMYEWSKIKGKELMSDDDFITSYQNEDLSDEIIQELLLRNLSFVTAKLLRNLLVPLNKSQSINISEGLKTNMSYVLQNYEILGPLLLLLSHLIMFHDTRTSHNAIRILQNTIPILIDHPNNQISTFVTTDLFKVCLMAINDAYLVSIHHEIVTILIQIYTLAHERKIQQCRDIFLSIEGLNSEKIHEFETKFFNAKNSKSKKMIMIDFLLISGIKLKTNGKNYSEKLGEININMYGIMKHVNSKINPSDIYKDILEQEDIGLKTLFE